jgi:hypothetical protein
MTVVTIGVPSKLELPLTRQWRMHRELMEKMDTLEWLLRSLGAVTPAELKARE